MRDVIRDGVGSGPGRWFGRGISYAPDTFGGREAAAPFAARGAALEGLTGSSLASRFRAWRGRSGRRYVFSVFSAGPELSVEHLPLGGPAVAMVVARGEGEARSILWIGDTGPDPARFLRGASIQAWIREAGCELHLFLRAGDAADRAAIVADLRAGA